MNNGKTLAVDQVVKRHKHPFNLKSISFPAMPKLIMKMLSLKISVLAREKNSHIIPIRADDLLLATLECCN